MELVFARGNRDQVKGHAILYFQGASPEPRVWATYLVVPPIPIQISKYLPAMFATKLPLGEMADVSAIPLPPVPEEVESLSYVKRLAEMRDDDIINGGPVDPSQVEGLLYRVTEVAQAYLELYNMRAVPSEESAVDAQALLYALMGEQEKLAELSRLAGKLRYAIDGRDARQIEEVAAEIEALGEHLAEKYRVPEFLAAARTEGERGARLAALYIERCYKIAAEDYRGVAAVEAQIREVNAEE